jgi:RND family efflux transporter MFP subunit
MLFTIVLPVLVLAGGAVLAVVLVKTSPKAVPRPPQRTARLVETTTVQLDAQPTVIRAFGTVQSAREVGVHPRVAGEIIAISPNLIPGGRFQQGEMMVQIDPRDFELAVRQREADVSTAEANLALEMGQQAVAQREYELLGEAISDENRDLVLRKPQLSQAQAALEVAKAALDLARLDLERTTVRAPFNATVRMRDVNVGMQVSPTTELAIVSGSDEYWIELTVPVDDLKWIRIPDGPDQPGSLVRVRSQVTRNKGTARQGRVLRLLPDLEPNGRLARVLVSVRDPLALQPENQGKPALILGDYVSAVIEGIGVSNAVALDRTYFRDGDQVWVMTPEHQLEIRPVTVAFRSVDTLLVSDGLQDGERVVVTDLPAALEGMALRTPEDPLPGMGTGPGPGTNAGGGGMKSGKARP